MHNAKFLLSLRGFPPVIARVSSCHCEGFLSSLRAKRSNLANGRPRRVAPTERQNFSCHCERGEAIPTPATHKKSATCGRAKGLSYVRLVFSSDSFERSSGGGGMRIAIFGSRHAVLLLKRHEEIGVLVKACHVGDLRSGERRRFK